MEPEKVRSARFSASGSALTLHFRVTFSPGAAPCSLAVRARRTVIPNRALARHAVFWSVHQPRSIGR